jgi:hypothetical protein
MRKKSLEKEKESTFENLHKYILIGELRVRLKHGKGFSPVKKFVIAILKRASRECLFEFHTKIL